jgi:hypothetical protein
MVLTLDNTRSIEEANAWNAVGPCWRPGRRTRRPTLPLTKASDQSQDLLQFNTIHQALLRPTGKLRLAQQFHS